MCLRRFDILVSVSVSAPVPTDKIGKNVWKGTQLMIPHVIFACFQVLQSKVHGILRALPHRLQLNHMQINCSIWISLVGRCSPPGQLHSVWGGLLAPGRTLPGRFTISPRKEPYKPDVPTISYESLPVLFHDLSS